jgi:hypothetical protein
MKKEQHSSDSVVERSRCARMGLTGDSYHEIYNVVEFSFGDA